MNYLMPVRAVAFVKCLRGFACGFETQAGVRQARGVSERLKFWPYAYHQGPEAVAAPPVSKSREETTAGEASPTLEKMAGERSPWPDLAFEPL